MREFQADTSLLLMRQLKQLREKEHMARARNQPVNKETVITRAEFEKNARELGVYNCEPFYSNSTFKSLNFAVSVADHQDVRVMCAVTLP